MRTCRWYWFSFPKGFGVTPEWRETGRQELSRKNWSEVGLQFRSPSFPIRLLFSEPVNLYTRTSVCAHTHAHSSAQQGVKVEVGLRLGHFSQPPLWRGMGKEVREQSEQGGLHMYMSTVCPAQEGGHVCPSLQSPGLGLKGRVILAGAKHGYQVWEQFVKEGC